MHRSMGRGVSRKSLVGVGHRVSRWSLGLGTPRNLTAVDTVWVNEGPQPAFAGSVRFGAIVCAEHSLWQGGEVHFGSPGKHICFGSSVCLGACKVHFAGAEKCIFLFPENRKQNLDGMEIAIVPAVLSKLWKVERGKRVLSKPFIWQSADPAVLRSWACCSLRQNFAQHFGGSTISGKGVVGKHASTE